MAERYERRSLLLSSNLTFSQWDRIFRNPMTTAAAIDRLVHHAVILEFDVASFRTEQARRRGATGAAEAADAASTRAATGGAGAAPAPPTPPTPLPPPLAPGRGAGLEP
jgi:hypothetical protein